MGAIIHVPKIIDVICQHNHDGTIIPMKMRLVDEDGETQTYVIKSYKCTSRPDVTKTPGNSKMTFEVKINSFGHDKYIGISYCHIDGLWRILGKD